MQLIQINNKAGKVKLDGSIHEGSMDALIDRMATLYGDDAVRNELKIGDVAAVESGALESLEIEINSPGGSVKQGYRAYKTITELRERGVHVTARITKLAASMGSIISAAADKVIIESKAKMMIHDAATMSWGNADEMKKSAELLDSVSNELAAIYANRTGKTVAEMRDLMKKETWMTADESIKAGLADEVYTKDPTSEKPKTKLDQLLDGEETAEIKIDIRATNPKPKAMSFLAKLFPGNDEVAKLEASILELDNVRASLDAVLQERDALKSEVSNHVETISGHLAAIGNLNERIAALEATAARVPELESAVIAAKASAATEATAMLASVGQPEPLPLESAAKPDPIKELTGLSRVAAAFKSLEK